MQLSIVSGIYTDMQANYRVSYPRNLVPVPKQTGMSAGYLRHAEGITQLTAAGAVSGADRGGFNWNGTCYRVIGSTLLSVDAKGVVTVLGDVGNDGKQVAFDRAFDFLIVGSASNLYYWATQPLMTVQNAAVSSAGTEYAVGDAITLTNDIGLVVRGVSGAGAITSVSVAHGGLSAVAGSVGPIGQSFTTGIGTGALFNLTWGQLPDKLYHVTTAALGPVVDTCWFAGYTVSTDGSNIIVTDLQDPSYVDPLKYGSSEYSPDPLVGLAVYRDELYVFNRYTTEVFDNVGGANFPFQVNEGAVVDKGTLSRTLKCKMAQRLWFVGSGANDGRGEATSVYSIFSGVAIKVATQEIEEVLTQYTEDQLTHAVLEAREDRVHQHLYLHLPDQTLVYDFAASEAMQLPVWFVLSSTASTYGAYRARNFVRCYNMWLCGDLYDSRIGYLDRTVATQYGAIVGHQFDVGLVYNESRGMTLRRLDLVGQTGLAGTPTADPTISLSYTRDAGKTYSIERFRRLGKQGDFTQRLMWLNVAYARQQLGLRFRGVTSALVSYARIDAQITPGAV